MPITPEKARAELARRESLRLSKREPNADSKKITPEMATAELARRETLPISKEEPQAHESGRPEGKPEESKMSRFGRSMARLPRNTVAGLLDMGDFLATPIREGLNMGAKALGIDKQIPTLASETTNLIDQSTNGLSAPQNDAEKIEESVQRGLVSLPVGGALGKLAQGAKYAPQAVKSVGNFLRGSNVLTPTNIASTAATTGSIQHSINKNPEDTSGAIISGLGAGLGVSSVPAVAGLLTQKGRGSTLSRLANKTAEKLSINPEAVEAFNKSGITPTLADVSKSDRVKMISSKMEKIPIVGAPLQEARDLQKNKLLEGLRQGEKSLTHSEASKIAKKGAKNYQGDKNLEFKQMFSKVEKDIQKLPDDTVGTEVIDKYFEPMFEKFKTASQERRFKKSPIGKIYTELYQDAKENGGKLPYHSMKRFLDDVNDTVTTHGLIGKVSEGELKGFGGAIAENIVKDLEPKFKTLGESSYKNWKEAKKYYAQYAEHDIPKLNEIYKKDKKGATEAFLDIVTNQKKGAEKAKIVLNGLDGKEKIELTDAIHHQFGRTTDGTFSPLKWVREFKSLQPEAQKVLLSPLDKSSQKKLNHIVETIDHMKSTLNEANTSKTSYYTALGTIATLAARAASHLVGGDPLPAVQLAAGLFAGRVISDKFLSNPKFINWLYKGMNAKNMNQFEKILNNVPHVGEGRKILQKEIQTFQHDLTQSKKENEKGKSKKNGED